MPVVVKVELLEGAEAWVAVVYELGKRGIARGVGRHWLGAASWLVPHAMTLLVSVVFGPPVVPVVPLGLGEGC